MSDQGREWAEKLAEILQRTSADITMYLTATAILTFC